jgi:hypothetical protein
VELPGGPGSESNGWLRGSAMSSIFPLIPFEIELLAAASRGICVLAKLDISSQTRADDRVPAGTEIYASLHNLQPCAASYFEAIAAPSRVRTSYRLH